MRRFFWLVKRTILQMIKGFTEDRLFQNASSLSFYTLLSIVPIFAIFFGIAQGFGLDQRLEQEIRAGFANHQEIADHLISFSRTLLSETRTGLIAGIGVITLLWTFIGMIGNFERALNDIWHVTESRNFFRRVSDFLSIALLCPFYFILSSSLTFFLSSEYIQISDHYPWINQIGPVLRLLIRMIPILLSFLVFSFLYYYIPNTKVPFKAALTAGFVAGVVFFLVQWIYIRFQIGLASYSAVYGSFAAIPLFLIWLQTSWLILLAGAELSYRITYNPHFEPQAPSGSIAINQKEIAMWMVKKAANKFNNGQILTLKECIQSLKFNHPFIKSVWSILVANGFLLEVKNDIDEGIVPAKPSDQIRLKEILDSVDLSAFPPLLVPETEMLKNIKEEYLAFDKESSLVKANLFVSNM